MESDRLDADRCYSAVVARDTRFDGHFFTAVRTTGVYCRPVCAARTPRRSSCDFYRTAAGAERAGFRPCLRCRPELAPGRVDFDATLADAIFARLQAAALQDVSIETLAARIGLSSRQVRRIVLDRFGVTPVEIAQTHRLLFAKRLLHETDLPMTRLAFAAGFRSLRRFNAAFVARYGIAPSALRRGTTVATDAVRRRGPASGRAADGDGDLVLRLSYRPPLDWSALAGFLAFRATAGIELVDRSGPTPVYRRTVALPSPDGSGGIVRGWLSVTLPPVRAARRHPDHGLEVTMSATLLPLLMDAMTRLRALLDLDADPRTIDAHLAADPLLAPCIAAAPGLRVQGAWDRFELALRAVLGQQVSVAGASTLAARLARRFGEAVPTPFVGLDRAAPTPGALANADLADIAAIGIPMSRARTVRELARFADAGGLSMPPATSCDDAVAALDALPGIGPWTANYIAMRALRHPDAFPAGGLGLRRALQRLEGAAQMPSEAALMRRAERWRPWRAYAAVVLWHSLLPAASPAVAPGKETR